MKRDARGNAKQQIEKSKVRTVCRYGRDRREWYKNSYKEVKMIQIENNGCLQREREGGGAGGGGDGEREREEKRVRDFWMPDRILRQKYRQERTESEKKGERLR